MSMQLANLTAMQIQHFTEPGNYRDGGGLYLQINPQGKKSWIFRYELFGRERYMGLGPLHSVSLADARIAAREGKRCLLDKVDPLEKKRQEADIPLNAETKLATWIMLATCCRVGELSCAR
jgi:hypothetical protein